MSIPRERQLVQKLRDDGWWAIRSPASKGDVDVVAVKRQVVKPAHTKVCFIEVKATTAGPFHSFGPSDRHDLSRAATEAGAEAWLVWWPKRKQPKWIPESDWP